MLDFKSKTGFTLVELAVVLVIIGLMLGGIMKGQGLIQNARVIATIDQIGALEAATITFRRTYGGLPGDIPNGDTAVPGCTLACKNPEMLDTSGDKKIGDPAWDMKTAQRTTPLPDAPITSAGDETVLYWLELSRAGLISGIGNAGITAGAGLSFGGSHLQARINGGYVVGYSNGMTTWSGRPGAPLEPYSLTGTVLALATSPSANLADTPGTQALSPHHAAQLDRRIDDGLPHSGYIQAFGVPQSCYGAAAPWEYQEQATTRDCGVYIRIK
jgi:prepilin-type N-terminal cleavage/methylation domain-containing protein